MDLASILSSRGYMMAAAESCTGGMIGSAITAVPGSSAYFKGSAVTYSNDSKEIILGVSHDTLMQHGAVSSETAGQMAEGVRELYGSDVSVAVTGIAGPDGGSAEKPVGLVYIAVSDGTSTKVERFLFSGNRDDVRSSTVQSAIEMLCKFLEGEE